MVTSMWTCVKRPICQLPTRQWLGLQIHVQQQDVYARVENVARDVGAIGPGKRLATVDVPAMVIVLVTHSMRINKVREKYRFSNSICSSNKVLTEFKLIVIFS